MEAKWGDTADFIVKHGGLLLGLGFYHPIHQSFYATINIYTCFFFWISAPWGGKGCDSQFCTDWRLCAQASWDSHGGESNCGFWGPQLFRVANGLFFLARRFAPANFISYGLWVKLGETGTHTSWSVFKSHVWSTWFKFTSRQILIFWWLYRYII